jgi:hypothetical protein
MSEVIQIDDKGNIDIGGIFMRLVTDVNSDLKQNICSSKSINNAQGFPLKVKIQVKTTDALQSIFGTHLDTISSYIDHIWIRMTVKGVNH